MSAGADLLGRGISLNFDGAASITVPNIAVPVADFVGEGAPIPVVMAPSTPGPTLTPHKLAVITALTGELMRSSNAEALVRQVLVDSTGPALDKVLFSANAAGPDRPAGLLNGITALTPAAAGGASKGEVLVDDVQNLATAVAPVAGNGNLVFVASPDAAVALALRLPEGLEWPVLISSALPVRTVICIASNAVVSAVQGAPQVEAATSPVLHMDSVPGEIVNVGGVSARPVGSVFQTDEVALRLRWFLTWGLRTPASVAWIQGVNW